MAERWYSKTGHRAQETPMSEQATARVHREAA